MNKLRKIGAFATAFLLVVTAAGCSSKPTAQSLAKDAGKNMSDIKSVRTVEKMDFDAAISMSGVSVDMAMDLDLDMKLINDPEVKGQLTMNMSIAAAGQSETMSMETYMEQDGDQLVTYSTEDGGATFTKSEDKLSDYDLNSMVDDTLYTAIEKGEIEATLREETETVNDTEAYVIETTLTGDQFKKVIESSFSELSDAEIIPADTDWSSMSAPTVLYIAKDTKYPVKMTMECSSLGDAIINAMLGAQDLGDTTIEIKNFDITLELSDYNAVADIEIPAAAKETQEDDTEALTPTIEETVTETVEEAENTDTETVADNGDDDGDVEVTEGSLTLTDGVMTAVVEVPSGFNRLYQSNKKYLSAFADAGSVFFYFNDYQTIDEFLESEGDVSYKTEDDGYKDVSASEVKKVTVGANEVSYVVVDFQYNDTMMRNFYAAMPAGNEILCAEIDTYDSSYTTMWDDSIIETVFSGITIQ